MFIRNFSKIIASLILMLQIPNELMGNKAQSIQAENQDTAGTVGRIDGGKVGKNIGNLSTIINLTKSKKSKLTKTKKSDLLNTKANLLIFLPLKPKRPSYTYKRFLLKFQFLGILIQSVIFGFNTDVLEYIIGKVLS